MGLRPKNLSGRVGADPWRLPFCNFLAPSLATGLPPIPPSLQAGSSHIVDAPPIICTPRVTMLSWWCCCQDNDAHNYKITQLNKVCDSTILWFENATTHDPLESLRKCHNLLRFCSLLCFNFFWTLERIPLTRCGPFRLSLSAALAPSAPRRVMGTWTGHDSTLRKEVDGGDGGQGGFALSPEDTQPCSWSYISLCKNNSWKVVDKILPNINKLLPVLLL